MVQEFLCQIRMWINESNPMPKGNVLQNQIAQQGGFPGARLPNDVDVLSLVNLGYAKELGITPALTLADCDGVIVHVSKISHHSCQ